MTPQPHRGTKQVLVPLQRPTNVRQQSLPLETIHHLLQSMAFDFFPLGLMLWGATPDTFVVGVSVGNQYELGSHLGELPGRYFTEGRSMEELRKLADSGDLVLTVPERQRLEMEVAELGVNINVRIRGPFDDVCLWGLTYSHRGPLLTQRIEPARWKLDPTGDSVPARQDQLFNGFRGQVIEHHLAGDRVLSEVYAPSEATVAQLLINSRRPVQVY